MAKTGARGKYDEETADQLIEVIRAGNYLSVACGAVGISRDTLYQWCKKYADFSDALKKARHEAQARNVALIAKAASKQWQAAAWYLERKHNDKWGLKQKTEISGKLENSIVIVKLPEEDAKD